MAAIARPLDEEAVSRWDGDGGSQPAPATAAVRPDADRFLRDVGLHDVAEVREGDVSFPLGILWPYTADLRRVRAEYDAALGSPTSGLLAALATLYERIAFAPGTAGLAVADVYNDVKDALGARRTDIRRDARAVAAARTFRVGDEVRVHRDGGRLEPGAVAL